MIFMFPATSAEEPQVIKCKHFIEVWSVHSDLHERLIADNCLKVSRLDYDAPGLWVVLCVLRNICLEVYKKDTGEARRGDLRVVL